MVLAATLPSNILRIWEFFTGHLTLIDTIALRIDYKELTMLGKAIMS